MNECISFLSQRFDGPQFGPVKILSVLVGSVCAIAALAGKVFGTMSAAESAFMGIIGGSFIAGGVTGYLAISAIAFVVLAGVSIAAPPGSVWFSVIIL